MSADMITGTAPLLVITPSQAQAAAMSPETARQTPPAPAQAIATMPPVKEITAKAVEQINEVMETFNKGIRFRQFENSNKMYVQIVNRETQEVIRTIPPEELLHVMQKLHEVLGMILDKRG